MSYPLISTPLFHFQNSQCPLTVHHSSKVINSNPFLVAKPMAAFLFSCRNSTGFLLNRAFCYDRDKRRTSLCQKRSDLCSMRPAALNTCLPQYFMTISLISRLLKRSSMELNSQRHNKSWRSLRGSSKMKRRWFLPTLIQFQKNRLVNQTIARLLKAGDWVGANEFLQTLASDSRAASQNQAYALYRAISVYLTGDATAARALLENSLTQSATSLNLKYLSQATLAYIAANSGRKFVATRYRHYLLQTLQNLPES
ncbi:hypothetical protein [Lacticaseibacillus manihotivorans]|uniref:hypothetical protein n=1 Tax=Lacticaseibacillus manihotivorans TaxID=88233 RepID=UPI001FB490B6|nr:hypothetical protein [Lacticaseibacillus manihotivorans]